MSGAKPKPLTQAQMREAAGLGPDWQVIWAGPDPFAEHEHLCVAFCDVDHFKRINDTHGHDAGDRVLRAVAHSLARISNDRCHVARHGGEEFVVLFRGQSLNEAWDVLEEARSQQAERRLVNRANDMPFGKITFSCGLADVFAYPDPRAALRGGTVPGWSRCNRQGRHVRSCHPFPDNGCSPGAHHPLCSS